MEKTLLTKDNIRIAFNHIKNGNKTVVIIAPGWLMTKDSRSFLDLSDMLSNYHDVITLDFRGHGKSSGFYTFTAKETEDLKTIVNFAKKEYDKIYLMGFSLGGALVLIHGAVEKDVDKIIAISAPTEFIKIENRMWDKNAYIPTFQKMELERLISIRLSIIPHKKIKPIDCVDKIDVPTLFIAGSLDPTVRAWHTETLFQKAKCTKKFELFKNGRHAEDLFIEQKDKFLKICLEWFEQ